MPVCVHRGIDRASFQQNSGVISRTPMALIQLIKSASEVGLWTETSCFNTVHTLPVMFKSGLLPGHGSSSGMRFWLQQVFDCLVPWHGAPSCWKWLISWMLMKIVSFSLRLFLYIFPFIVVIFGIIQRPVSPAPDTAATPWPSASASLSVWCTWDYAIS